MAFQVEFTDRDGDTCWADFSDLFMAQEYIEGKGGEIVSWEEFADDEDEGQPDEYTEWQDYMGGDDWDHGQFDEIF